MTLRQKLALVAVTYSCVPMTGVAPAFADAPIGRTKDSTAAAVTVTVPTKFNSEGDPIALPVPGQLSPPPVIPAGKSFVKRIHQKMRKLRSRILYYRKATESWARIMGLHAKPVSIRRLASMSLPVLQRQVVSWKGTANKTRIRAQNPPHLAQFLCIHGYEASWTDTGLPYFGGIQFGPHEWRRFGYPFTHKHYAYQATPLEQIWSGERYWQVSGFRPWPNTARYCGLL